MTKWRALTVQPPWSWGIVEGGKDVENRSWPIPAKHLQQCPDCSGKGFIRQGSGYSYERFPCFGCGPPSVDGCGTGTKPFRVMLHAGTKPERWSERWVDADGDQYPLDRMPYVCDSDQVEHAEIVKSDDGHHYRLRWTVVSAIVAVVEFTGQHHQSVLAQEDRCLREGRPAGVCSPWAQFATAPANGNAYKPMWHWEIGKVTALAEPVAAKGRLGLWVPSQEIIEAVEAYRGFQLRERWRLLPRVRDRAVAVPEVPRGQ